jgi:membrane-associated phospholipid phosphatase
MKSILWCLMIVYLSAPLHAQHTEKSYKLRPFIAPLVLFSYGLTTIDNQGFPSSRQVKSERDLYIPHFRSNVDDYLVITPALTVYALQLLKVKSEHAPLRQTMILLESAAATTALVYALKYTVAEERPDKSDKLSFPSGHTAVAFAFATVLKNEFKSQTVVPAIIGYSLASAVGTMRIANDKHWYADVLCGAGLGIATAEVIDLLNKKIKYKKDESQLGIIPVLNTTNFGLLAIKKF